MAKIFANIYTTRYGFDNEDFAETVYQVFEIELQCLIKPKQIKEFNDEAVKSITHAYYSTFTIDIHIDSPAL